MAEDTVTAINAFWLGESLTSPEAAYARRDWWYKGGPAVDAEILERFNEEIERGCRGEFTDWATTGQGALALILILDQFTRNIYRHSPDACRGDARALHVVKDVIARGIDTSLQPVERIWLYHPFHHSEVLEEQEFGASLLEAIHKSASPDWHAFIERSIWGWRRHRSIVARYGRFPHRNEVLGRESTPEELAFLAQDGEAFGQGRK